MDVDADGADDVATNTENDTANPTNNTGSGGGDADTGVGIIFNDADTVPCSWVGLPVGWGATTELRI